MPEVRDAAHDALPGAVEPEPHPFGPERDLHVPGQAVARRLEPPDRRRNRVALNAPGKQVGVADEGGHELVRGTHIERRRVTDLEHAPGLHDRDAVGEAQGFLLVVRHEHGRRLRLAEDGSHLAPNVHPQGGVEVRERLVQEHESWLGGKRSRQRHTLLLPPGQLVRQTGGLPGQADEVEHLCHAAVTAGAVADAVPDVLRDREVREERVVLEHDADAPPLRRDESSRSRHVGAVEDDAPTVRTLETGDEPQRRRLAATARPEQRKDLALVDREFDAVDGAHGTEVLGEAVELDNCAHRLRVALPDMAELHDTTEEYLETILAIEEEGVPPLRARLVERLGLSAAAVSETVNRLVALGYTELRDDRTIRLTEKGRRLATTVVRRHRLAERLLTDVIGLEWEKVHREAARWEHAISADVEQKLVELLGDPVTCPHGNPIPGSRRKGRASPTVPLAKAEPGRVTIARISEKLELNDDGLSLLARARLIPGASATIVERKNGEVRMKTAAGEHTVPAEVAEQMYVAAPA
jgi:DtxR family transcriptional regulator, Mn-dependent transcriptional regulator